MKKLIAIATTLTVAAMIVGPGTANALTVAELQAQIDLLLAQITTLQSQLVALGGTTTGTGVAVSCTFSRNLYPGMSGADVKCLQQYLNASGNTVSATGAGSPGNETEYFGSRTQGGVQKWQDANGVVYGNYGGYFGPKSITKYNALAAAGTTPVDNGTIPVTPSAGGLSVTLASSTPASDTIADNANANFTKFILSASSAGDVSISKIYVTRSGLSANVDIENIKIIDAATDEYKGSIGSLNVNNEAMITFIPNLVIPAGTSKAYYIRAGIKDDTSAGKTAILGIVSNDDIVSNAVSVTGAPITGNAMSVVLLAIGSVTLSEVTTVNTLPDVGDTGVPLLGFKIAAGSTEPVTIETITVMRKGTSSISDTANIELYNVTNSESLATVTSWSAEDKATFSNLNLKIAKGKNLKFEIRVEIISGVSSTAKTVYADIVDGSDELIVVKGDTYGFYISPVRDATDWDGLGTSQSINAGSLHISKSASTPATGNVAIGDDVVLGIFDFYAKGEDIKISGISVDFTAAYLANSDITNVKIVDEDGDTVVGPKAVAGALTADFTDMFIVPVGTSPYTVTATLADSISNGITILARMLTVGTTSVLEAVGMTSNDDITATPDATVDANTLTVAAAVLTVSTESSPAGRSIPLGTSDFIFATFSFDAGASGEDINVTAITVTDSLGGAAAYADIDNATLWADLTSAQHADRGDNYETRISDPKQWSAATLAFTLTQTLKVAKGTIQKIALVADLASGGGTGNHTFKIADDADSVAATGATTGEDATETYATANKQTMASTDKGVLTVTFESEPLSNIIIGEETLVPLAVFKLAASNVEDLDLDNITVNVSNADSITTLYFFNGDTELGRTSGIVANTYKTTYFSDNTLIIPANDDKLITVKADIAEVDGTTTANDDSIIVALSGTTTTTGKASGQQVTSTSFPVSKTMYIYESRPYVTIPDNTPTTTALIPSTSTLVALFDVTADAGKKISFINATGLDANNNLTVQVAAQINDTTQDQLSFTLKDSDGNTLDSNVQAADSNSTKVMNTSVTFLFDSYAAGFNITAGQTKQLKVYLDTTDFDLDSSDESNAVRLWLDDSANDIDWGINGSGSYNLGNLIFRGDLYANSLSNSN